MPESTSVMMIAAISLALASLASLTVVARVVTPLLIWAVSGGTWALPVPVTTIRPSEGDGGCCACSGLVIKAAAANAAACNRRRQGASAETLFAKLDADMGLSLEHFPEKWTPIFRQEMRQTSNPERFPTTSVQL